MVYTGSNNWAIYRLTALTDLVFLKCEELVTCWATADQFSTIIEGGETQPEQMKVDDYQEFYVKTDTTLMPAI